MSSGDPNKLIVGSDFDTEFDAISTAIASKADVGGDTFTGNVTVTGDFTVTDSTANADVLITISNDAQSYRIGVEGSDADKLIIHDVTNTTDRITMTSAGAVTVAGATTLSSTLTVTGLATFTGRAIVDDVTDATSGTDGSLQTDGGLSVAKAAWIGTTVTADSYLASADDSGALGASGTAFSDLFLASGGVINFNAGDITVTHSASQLAIAGAVNTSITLTDQQLLFADTTTVDGEVRIRLQNDAQRWDMRSSGGTSDAWILLDVETSATVVRVDKGHSSTLTIGDKVLTFDDADVDGDVTIAITNDANTFNLHVDGSDSDKFKISDGTTDNLEIAAGIDVIAILAASGLTIKDTSLNSEPAFFLQNDAQVWQLITRGTVSDAFQLLDSTGGNVNFQIDAGHTTKLTLQDAGMVYSDTITVNGNVSVGLTNDAQTWTLFNNGPVNDAFLIFDSTGGSTNFQIDKGHNAKLTIADATLTFADTTANSDTKVIINNDVQSWRLLTAGSSGDSFVLDDASITHFQITAPGNVILGFQTALATTATDGYMMIPTCAGTPTGVPTAVTGKVALHYDTTGNKLWVYDGGWIGVALA